jgi:small multidrug resistance pump
MMMIDAFSFTIPFYCYHPSMIGFNMSLAKINVSVAYALWSAFGTFFVTVVGICFFHETIDPIKFLCIAMIVAGVMGLNMRS